MCDALCVWRYTYARWHDDIRDFLNDYFRTEIGVHNVMNTKQYKQFKYKNENNDENWIETKILRLINSIANHFDYYFIAAS